MDDRATRARGSDALTTMAWCALLVACGPAPSADPAAPSDSGTGPATVPLSVAGFAVRVPDSWTRAPRAVVGTALQRQATECVAAEALDGAASPLPGVADLPRTAVQICVVPRRDGLGLDAWLAGRGVTSVTRTRYGTCDTLTPPGSDARRLTYAQSADRRAEIVTTTTSTPSTSVTARRAVVDALASMTCPTS